MNIIIWDLRGGEIAQTLMGHKYFVSCVAWSPFNPSLLASASSDNTAAVWNVETGKAYVYTRGVSS